MSKFTDNIKDYLKAIKSGEKKLSKDGMLILFFSGLLIYVITLPINNNSSYKKNNQVKTIQQQAEYPVTEPTHTDYQEKLEKELAEFLSQVEGIGEAEVLIYLSGSEEYIVEKDVPTHLVSSAQQNSTSEEENREEDTVYTVNADGEQVPFVAQTKNPVIEGVVIAAEGAGREEIRIQIIRTVMALYGVDANKIDVLERKKS